MTELHPFFYFYGAKYRSARRYPRPRFTTLIEPFAGAAGYALHYPTLSVCLYDIDPIICGIWDYLIHVSTSEILQLPLEFESVDTVHTSQEAKWLLGFWINQGAASPCKTVSKWGKDPDRQQRRFRRGWGEPARARIAQQVEQIRHWKVSNSSYDTATDIEATWFIDPPYATPAGRYYRFSEIDYEALGHWCLARQGQVVVCEQQGSTWLPFQPFGSLKGTTGLSKEVVWLND